MELIIQLGESGKVCLRVNTSTIEMQDSWQGMYFPDYPVELEIIKLEKNQKFLGWYSKEGQLISNENKIILCLHNGRNTIYPKFEFI